MNFPYSESLSTVLDGAGGATLTFNGPPPLTRRALSNIVVNCSSSVPRPNVTIYRSGIARHRRMAFSRLGDDDTFSSDPGDVLETGEPLIIVWAGGLAGARVTANVNGSDLRA